MKTNLSKSESELISEILVKYAQYNSLWINSISEHRKLDLIRQYLKDISFKLLFSQ